MHACTPKCLTIALLSLGWFQKLSSVKNELIHYSLVHGVAGIMHISSISQN